MVQETSVAESGAARFAAPLFDAGSPWLRLCFKAVPKIGRRFAGFGGVSNSSHRIVVPSNCETA